MNLAPVETLNLTDAVERRVLDGIRSSALKPGDVLPGEQALAAQLGISRSMEQQAGAGAEFGRIEKVDISYETKDGKPVKLEKPLKHYYGEFQNGKKRGEAMVTADGEPVKE